MVCWLGMVGCMMGFLAQRRRLLSCILAMEGMIISGFLMAVESQSFGVLVCLVLLCLGVCEASLSLGLLVGLSRRWGSDLLSACSSNSY